MEQNLKDRLIKAIEDGRKTKDLAVSLFMTEKQLRLLLESWGVNVPKRKRFLNIPRPPRDELINIYNELRTTAKVANKLGVGINTVNKWMRDLKIPTRRIKLKKEDQVKLLEEHFNLLNKDINL